MKARLLLLWDRIHSSYWFLPALMLLLAAVLAFALIALDQRIENDSLQGMWWVYTGGEDGARQLLSTVAGSVMTVAGVTFSITIAVLSLTSSQFGPRLLRGFMRDTGNQMVLGTFLGTFLYCLLVLRTVRGVEEVRFVPHIAVTGGVVLAVASVCVLVFFIHHVSVSIQADQIIAAVAADLEEAIDRLFPESLGEAGSPPAATTMAEPWEKEAVLVAATDNGYVQAVDGDALLGLAVEKDLRMRLRRRPGQFVTRGSALALIWPPDRADDNTLAQLNEAFSLGDQRTLTQDAEFAVDQLVEVAARALSPGINDPFTATRCLDRLGASLCHLAQRNIPSPLRCDERGTLRVITESVTYSAIADAAFNPIRHYGRDHPVVIKHLLDVIGDVISCARTQEQRDVLRRHAVWTLQAGDEDIPGREEQAATEEQYRKVMQVLGETENGKSTQ